MISRLTYLFSWCTLSRFFHVQIINFKNSICGFPLFTPTDWVLADRFHPAEVGPLLVGVAIIQSPLTGVRLEPLHPPVGPALLLRYQPDPLLSHGDVFVVDKVDIIVDIVVAPRVS